MTTTINPGDRYMRLTVVELLGGNPYKVKAVCDCGTERAISKYNWGKTQSCGCLHREQLSARLTRHGMAGTPTYKAWGAMIQRCTNPKDRFYADYGGRGIKVCDRWRDFANFLADMGERPRDNLSLDRIDNEGNYEPGNCRWATASEQNSNRRPRELANFCQRGHPLDGDNVYVESDGYRRCRTCDRARGREADRRRRGRTRQQPVPGTPQEGPRED